MLKKIGIAVLLAVVVLVVAIATRPSAYKVERSAVIDAPADVVYAHLVEFKKWQDWSPWAKLDPNQKSSFEGTDGSVGASMSWSGNDKVGTGKMTLTEATPGKHIGIKLEFKEPFTSTSNTAFDLAPQGEQTKVTWAMSGENDFMGKAMSMFMNMDEMVGKDFEKGLAQMKTLDEDDARKMAEAKKKAAEEAAAAAAANPDGATPAGAVAADQK